MDQTIRTGGTRIERTLFRVMRKAGLTDLRCEAGDLPGTPDVVSDKMKIACFAHGCFWHHHAGCRLARLPSTNTEFWSAKFAKNQVRDRRAVEALQSLGWSVVTMWECADVLGNARELQTSMDRALKRDGRHAQVLACADGTRRCATIFQ